jgi:hypothetical protein
VKNSFCINSPIGHIIRYVLSCSLELLQIQIFTHRILKKLEIDLSQIFFGGRPATPDTITVFSNKYSEVIWFKNPICICNIGIGDRIGY